MGIDFIQNVGLLGFINYPSLFTPYVYQLKILLNLLIISAFAINLKLVGLKNNDYFYLLFFSAIFLTEWDSFLYILFLILLLKNYSIDEAIEININYFIITPLCISLLILAKLTFLFISILIFFLYFISGGIYNIGRIVLVLLYLSVIYYLNNIEIESIILQLKNIYAFTSGYNSAMALSDSYMLLVPVVLLYSFFNIFIIYSLSKFENINYYKIIFILILFYIIWKHSIVRSDHLLILLQCILFFILYTYLKYRSKVNIVFQYFLIFTITLCVICMQLTNGNLISSLYESKNRILDNLSSLISFNKNYEENIFEFQLNSIIPRDKFNKCIILNGGPNKFAYWGYIPHHVILNKNLLTNKIPVSFTGWNEYTKSKSVEFITNNVELLVVDYKSIDNNYLYLDDSLTQIEIVNNFKYLKKCGRSEIFIRNQNNNKIHFSIINKSKIKLNTNIELPTVNSNELLVAEIKINQSYLNILRSFIYKPVQYNLVLDNKYEYKFNLESSKSNFIMGIPETFEAKNSLDFYNINYPNYFMFKCNSSLIFCNSDLEIIIKKGIKNK